MKSLLIAIFSFLLMMNSSCATIFANKTACHQKPGSNEPKRKIRTGAFIADILLGYGVGLGIDFATGAIYKPCEQKKKLATPLVFDWSETIEVPGISKEALFQRGIEWFNSTFNDMRAVIQSQDKEAGTFYAKGVILSQNFKSEINNQYFGSSDIVSFSVNISVKDGKYKYTISNFIHSGTSTSYSKTKIKNGGNLNSQTPACRMTKKQWRTIRELVKNEVTTSFIPSLKTKMKSASMPESF